MKSDVLSKIEELRGQLGYEGRDPLPGDLEALEAKERDFRDALAIEKLGNHKVIQVYVKKLRQVVIDISLQFVGDEKLLLNDDRKLDRQYLLLKRELYRSFLAIFDDAAASKDSIANDIHRALEQE